jgi:hypothetical protein
MALDRGGDMTTKAIPQRIKTILAQAIVRTLAENEITIPIQTIEI